MSDTTTHYTVMARRFRPQTFEEVVGQDRIGLAIRNAIRAGRVAHAYLFTGARGVGKTSTARIFAKALNCPNAKDAVPCNECDVCRSISAGHDVDVLEIDGASNRGIDDIRSLRANVTVRSMRSQFKVYIIDEVHMLTKEAFNALLKTLEEPPPNVKFVFCTTEPNKVPDTILSRCQRFDFGTIAPAGIIQRLEQIARAEGVDVAPEALELLARRAAGSMRDSQSLFDQLLAFGGEQITAADVHQLLGTAPDDRLVELFDAIIGRRRNDALLILDSAMNEGVQIGAFSDQLIHYLRDLLIVSAGAGDIPLEGIAESQRGRLSEQAAAWGLRTVTAALEILAATKAKMQRVSYDRALLELAIIRLSLLEELDSIGALLSGGPVGGANGGAGRGPSAPAGEGARPARTVPSGRTAPTASRQTRTPPTNLASASVLPMQVDDGEIAAPVPVSTPGSDAAPLRGESVSAGESDPREPRRVELRPENLDRFWTQVVSVLPDRLASHLARCDNKAIPGPNRLEISFPQSYVLSRQFCERPEVLGRLVEAATAIAGMPVEVGVVTSAQGEGGPSPLRRESSRQGDGAGRRKKAEVEKDPYVQQALDIFGGTLIDAREIVESTTVEH